MNTSLPKKVALVGAGVIGRGWIRVFAPHGVEVSVYDPNPEQIPLTLAWLAQDLAADVAEGFLTPGERATIIKMTHGEGDLATALADADYVQESAPEKLDVKQALFAELDRLAPAKAIIASSTSALDIGEIAKDLPGQRRCLMAHPFNPPHLMPVVEMLAAPATDPAILQKACDMLEACGQIPVRMNRYVKGFLGNRIQAAVVREALHLVETGVADPVAVDAVIRDALALRWATIGNFGANHANADEGIAQYFSRYGDSYAVMMADLDSRAPRFDPEVLRRIADAIEEREGVKGVPAFVRKRDVMVKELNNLKRRHEVKR
ncbi:3-hydroxyacyl-CoA dehydrogenase [soil metagenome]